MLAALGDVAALQHAVEIRAQLGERGVEPLDFLRQVLGDVVLDDDARLVQHDMAERDAFREDRAGLLRRMARGRLGPGWASADNSPEAISSASTMAVVCSASSSSST